MAKVLRFTPFTAGEQAILDRYFQSTAPDPGEQEPLRPALDAIVGSFMAGSLDERRLDVAAAVILSRHIDVELPAWSFLDEQGAWRSTRELETPTSRRVGLLSHRIFTINWADSGPGFSWLEEYRLTWAPGNGRFVVTASSDTDEAYGYQDVALGHFRPGPAVALNKVRQIICRRWRVQKRETSQERWQGVAIAGLVSTEEATVWRDRVWGSRQRKLERDDW